MKITLTLDVTQEQLLALFTQVGVGTNNQALKTTAKEYRALKKAVDPNKHYLAPEAYRYDPSTRPAGQIGTNPKLNPEGFKAVWAMHLEGRNQVAIGKVVGLSGVAVGRIIKKIQAFKAQKIGKEIGK